MTTGKDDYEAYKKQNRSGTPRLDRLLAEQGQRGLTSQRTGQGPPSASDRETADPDDISEYERYKQGQPDPSRLDRLTKEQQ